MKKSMLQIHQITLIILFLIASSPLFAQEPSAILDVESTTQGILAPRMTSGQRTAIFEPAQGLLVYDTETKSFWYYENDQWNELGQAQEVSSIEDADGDTKVETEASADEDVIRLTANNREQMRLGDTIVRFETGVQLGGLNQSSSGQGDIQLYLGGTHNQEVNLGSTSGTYKLLIDGYNNDGGNRIVYPIFARTENLGADFFIKNADGFASPSIGYFGGRVGIGTMSPALKLHIANGTDVNSNAGTGYIQTGSSTSLNIGIDNNEIQARNADTAATLFLQVEGGPILIGSTALAAGYKMCVDGKVACEEVLVELSGNWPDYVFKPDYNLPSLQELATHIQRKGHLPGVPNATEIEENGIEVGHMNKILLEKIEELTLYILQQEERIKALENK